MNKSYKPTHAVTGLVNKLVHQCSTQSTTSQSIASSI